MGPTDNSSLPIRAHPDPIPGQIEPADIVLKIETQNGISGGQGAPGQRSHGGSSIQVVTHPKYIFLVEKKGETEASYKSSIPF